MYRQRNKLITRYRGLSTDDKPQNADHGSAFHEMDTGAVYYYDAENEEWYEASGNVQFEYKTVSGNPITVSDAVSAKIKSLVLSHVSTQSGTPTPSVPVDIVCNNGTLRYGVPEPVPSDRIYAYISSDGIWCQASDSYSICIGVEVGKTYAIKWAETGSSLVGTIFRYGFSDTSTPANQVLTQVTRTTPQSTPFVKLTADKAFLVIQVSTSYAQGILSNGRLILQEQRLYVDGTPEVLTVIGKNLLNVAANTEGYYISASGAITQDSSTQISQYSDLIPVKAGEKYTWSLISKRATSGNNRLHGYNASGVWVQQIDYSQSGTSDALYTLTVTIPSGISFVRLSYGINDTDAMFENGATKTEYAAYSAQTASVDNLFSVDDVADEHDIISGVVTRKIGFYVFDGTETLSASQSYTNCIVYSKNNHGWDVDTDITPFCTHFEGIAKTAYTQRHFGQCFLNNKDHLFFSTDQSLNDFKAFLAEQYAAGTPVIMLYALTQETTEQVTAQPLDAYSEGTTVRAGSGTDITMTYKAKKGD